ncbi:MAG: U32 family peptidase [Bdellovibrionales bacterium]
MNNLELLMPAGSSKKLDLALDYGADAVYLGPPYYSLRARQNDFQKDKLGDSIQKIHDQNKKVYMTLNIFSRNRKLGSFAQDIKDFAYMKPDAFIISDPGLGMIASELAPEIPIHLSTQANCMNWKSVKFWQQSLNVTRVILSRELSVREISEIHKRCPDIELEAFVHGSICIAYSGRCLLSSYMNNRDPNQGVCDNSCREKFQISSKKAQEFTLEDTINNPGEFYPLEEDEHGTYVLNAKDLCMIEHLKELADAGVVSFKVEGRTKSEFYSAMIARAYRGALDDLNNGRPFNPYWKGELNKLTNRGYHTAFMFGDPKDGGQNYEYSNRLNQNVKLLGVVRESSQSQPPLVEIKNKIACGQKVRWLCPDGAEGVVEVEGIVSQKGQEKTEVHSGAGQFFIKTKTPFEAPLRSLLMTHEEKGSSTDG